MTQLLTDVNVDAPAVKVDESVHAPVTARVEPTEAAFEQVIDDSVDAPADNVELRVAAPVTARVEPTDAAFEQVKLESFDAPADNVELRLQLQLLQGCLQPPTWRWGRPSRCRRFRFLHLCLIRTYLLPNS
mgnify:CR=1 FL=1